MALQRSSPCSPEQSGAQSQPHLHDILPHSIQFFFIQFKGFENSCLLLIFPRLWSALFTDLSTKPEQQCLAVDKMNVGFIGTKRGTLFIFFNSFLFLVFPETSPWDTHLCVVIISSSLHWSSLEWVLFLTSQQSMTNNFFHQLFTDPLKNVMAGGHHNTRNFIRGSRHEKGWEPLF